MNIWPKNRKKKMQLKKLVEWEWAVEMTIKRTKISWSVKKSEEKN